MQIGTKQPGAHSMINLSDPATMLCPALCSVSPYKRLTRLTLPAKVHRVQQDLDRDNRLLPGSRHHHRTATGWLPGGLVGATLGYDPGAEQLVLGLFLNAACQLLYQKSLSCASHCCL